MTLRSAPERYTMINFTRVLNMCLQIVTMVLFGGDVYLAPPPPNVCGYKLFVGAPGTPQAHVFFNRAPNLGLKKLLFGPWPPPRKILWTHTLKKRAKRGVCTVLGDF